ncbi:MAG: rhomboid family intramembrane serine protease [Bacteroidales bacterium]|jgi:membrane associated rhomboid family serine protease|nr:rhomboid family intramembrane serine protease [Bacteroidales bacterium]
MSNYSLSGFSGLTPVVKNLLLLNVAMFIIDVILRSTSGFDLSHLLGLHYIASADFKPIQFVSYMFLHGDIGHLFFNMFALWMFGTIIEQFWGAQRFFIFYMVCGIGAGVVQIVVAYIRIRNLAGELPPEHSAELLNMLYNEGGQVLMQGKNYVQPLLGQLNVIINTTTIGASGAIFGLLMAFGMLFPNAYLYIFFAIPIQAKYFVILYGAIEFFAGMSNSASDNVAHFAHLGGMIFAFVLIMWWRKRGVRSGGF